MSSPARRGRSQALFAAVPAVEHGHQPAGLLARGEVGTGRFAAESRTGQGHSAKKKIAIDQWFGNPFRNPHPKFIR